MQKISKQSGTASFRATTLEELCDHLNEMQEITDACNQNLGDIIRLDSLPTFGGEEPADTIGIFSWNATHFLRYDDLGWIVVERETPLHKQCSATDCKQAATHETIDRTYEVDIDGGGEFFRVVRWENMCPDYTVVNEYEYRLPFCDEHIKAFKDEERYFHEVEECDYCLSIVKVGGEA